jgi:hypothetical protein
MKGLFIMVSLSLTALAGMTYLQSCKKCEKDPCEGQSAANTDFQVLEKLIDMEFETDTILSSCNTKIIFRPKNDADSFIWTLGAETINKKEFWRSCGWPVDDWVTVRLISIKSAAKNPCIPKSQLRDTLTKRFFVIDDKNPAWVFNGIFLGANTDSPEDTFRVSVLNKFPYMEGLPKGLLVKKFDPGASFRYNAVGGGKSCEFRPVETAPYLLSCEGYMVEKNGKITIQYKYDENALQKFYDGIRPEEWKKPPFKMVNKTWVGRKLP